MTFLEKDLEQIIWETDNSILQKKNLEIYGKKLRQLKIGNYGIADLVTINREYDYCFERQKCIPYLDVRVYELKKEKVGISAFLQAIRYCKGIKSYIEAKNPYMNFKLNISLISKEVDLSGDFIYIPDLIKGSNFGFIDNIQFYSFSYTIDGMVFNRSEYYKLIHEGF